ncbi:hypothetical protein KOM00_10430 [Geomonas sp. Red69]|uniref:hypothetical protein n=1 Tax=Geomonas diazotrophica TaxID=2843197 RepID=UPI001C1111F8|nr:hypothetical protein [Geomonas diazotrophica]MBU5637149.1 hypothetical protein [Geomonas diazotrophica]
MCYSLTANNDLHLEKKQQQGAAMIFFAILLKAVLWVIVFRSAVRCDARAMLLRCSCIAVALTVIDIFSVAANLRFSAFVLTLAL